MPRHPRKKLLLLSRNQQRKNLRDLHFLLQLLLKSWYLLKSSSLPIPATILSRYSFRDICGLEVRSLVRMIALPFRRSKEHLLEPRRTPTPSLGGLLPASSPMLFAILGQVKLKSHVHNLEKKKRRLSL